MKRFKESDEGDTAKRISWLSLAVGGVQIRIER